MEIQIRKARDEELVEIGSRAPDSAWPAAAFDVWETEHDGLPVLVWDETDLAEKLSSTSYPLDAADLDGLGSPLVWLMEFSSIAARDGFLVSMNWRGQGARKTGVGTVVAELRALRAPSPVPMGSAYTSTYVDALAFVAIAHAGQIKKGTSVPYLPHLLRVSARVWTEGGSENQAIGALLHDTIEDVGSEVGPLIDERFGETVLAIVKACSDTDEAEKKPPFVERKLSYMKHLSEVDGEHRLALLVTAADKLDNLNQIIEDLERTGPELWARFKGGRVGTIWYYRTIARILRTHDGLLSGYLLDELDSLVDTLASSIGREPSSSVSAAAP